MGAIAIGGNVDLATPCALFGLDCVAAGAVAFQPYAAGELR